MALSEPVLSGPGAGRTVTHGGNSAELKLAEEARALLWVVRQPARRLAERPVGILILALLKLEENQEWLGYYDQNGGFGVLLCTSPINEVTAAFQYWRQRDPYRGPVMRSWKLLIAATPEFIARRHGKRLYSTADLIEIAKRIGGNK